MVEAEIPEEEPPAIVKQAFDYLIKECQDANSLEDKKKMMNSIKMEENVKVYNLWFGDGEQNYGFTVIGLKAAINTYDVTDIQFIFTGPRGIAHKRLTVDERRVFLKTFELKLLQNNFDINTYKFIPEQ